MKRIAVFCGSRTGAIPKYAEATDRLAHACVRRGLGLVYGGASVGLMRKLAEAVSNAGGEIIGVIPEFLIKMEGAQCGLADLRIVRSMHERKAMMADLSDGIVALPGGLGTLEEFFETLTWTQLGIHSKPCGLLNICGYYNHLLRFLDHAVSQHFVKPIDRNLVLAGEDPEEVLSKMESYGSSETSAPMTRKRTAVGARV
jgi:uncharacterized protein (TIGR00730 family)